MLGRLLIRLITELSALATRVEAMQRALDAHGIPADEIDRIDRELRLAVRDKFERDVAEAKRAAEIGDGWRGFELPKDRPQ